MSDPIEHYENYGFSEVYEIVRTLVLVRNEKTYRIEILKCYSNRSVPFTAHCWMEQTISMEANAENVNALVQFNIPWIARDTADSALAQALSFLREEIVGDQSD